MFHCQVLEIEESVHFWLQLFVEQEKANVLGSYAFLNDDSAYINVLKGCLCL